MSRLWVSGLLRGGDTGFLYEAFPVTHSRPLTGSFWAGETRLFYVEGDQEFVCEPGMTVAEFAARNNGSFLVLTVKMGDQPTAATRGRTVLGRPGTAPRWAAPPAPQCSLSVRQRSEVQTLLRTAAGAGLQRVGPTHEWH
jgi:hypothetical protein